MKKVQNNKNGSFNTMMSREKEINARKIKITIGCRGKPFGREKKPQVSKDEYPLLCQALYYVKMEVSLVQW